MIYKYQIFNLMKYFIDQSGKIENTAKNTILCLSNGTWDAVILKAAVKRQLQEIFRRHGMPRNFVLFTFSALLAILIKRNLKLQGLTVDREYYGKEPVIKEIVLQILADNQTIPKINFAQIGKNVNAHDIAAKIAHKKERAKHQISIREVLSAIKKTEVGKQLKNA